MSGGPGYHGWTHRPASQGGTDPIPGVGSWCALGRGTGVTIDAGSSYDTDEFVEWESFAQYGDTAYFAQMTDGNGVPGVKIQRPGLYSVQSIITVAEANGSDVVPPTLRWMIAYGIDGSDDFGTGAYSPTLTGGWLHHASAAYVPPTISPVSKKMVLGGAFTWPFTSDELASYGDSLTGRIVSEGGSDTWSYTPAAIWIFYLGPIAES